MPFKLKLKKSKQYNVASKNMYVVAVELLDNTVVECTLSAESTGLDCLNNVCQRLSLYQAEYFGLQFLTKKRLYNWVELDRPLKKQLEKFCADTCMARLILGVQYYVHDVQLIYDEITRYQYFLQLKAKIINGQLPCTPEQAVLLASYSLQAEFGDHDSERHTAQYLKDFILLPKHLTNDENKLKILIEEVAQAHRSLQGLVPSVSEVYYIMECQQLEGYGQELYAAKDEAGNDLTVGPSLAGILLNKFEKRPSIFYRWSDIVNLVHHKKTFYIECQRSELSIYIHLDDIESAKYIWKMCVLQHRFFTKNIQHQFLPSSYRQTTKSLPDFTLSKLDRDVSIQQTGKSNVIDYNQSLEDISSGFNNEANKQYENRQRTYSLRISHSTFNNDGSSLAKSYNPSGQTCQNSVIENSKSTANLESIPINDMAPVSSSVSLPGLISVAHQISPADSEIDQLKQANLPAYRPAPDYETAMRHKYRSSDTSMLKMSNPPLGHSYYYGEDSHAELTSSGSSVQLQHHPENQLLYSRYQNFQDLSHIDSNGGQYIGLSGNELSAPQHPRGPIERTGMMGPGSLMIPPIHTYSTPELTSQGTMHGPQDQIMSDIHLVCQYKPPPPYPYNQRSSSSTPDLASQTFNNMVANSSPDLMYRKLVEDVNRLTESESRAVPQVPLQNASQHSNVETSSMHPSYNSSHRKNDVPVAPKRVASQPDVLPVHSISGLNNLSQHAQPGPQTPVACGPVYAKRQISAEFSSEDQKNSVGPMMLAAMNGLTLSRPDLVMDEQKPKSEPFDPRRATLEAKLMEGQVFKEFEQIPKKKAYADFKIASANNNVSRNRYLDVLPYDDNRIRLTPSKDNKAGYINASQISVTVGKSQRFYIAAQGPLPNTVHDFWQMVWEQNVQLIVMLTEVQESGKEKCFLYWPQSSSDKKLQFGEFQVTRKFSNNSETFVTTSLTIYHSSTKQERSIWHIQYTDWSDHGCPDNVSGYLSFMEEIDSVRRHAASERRPGRISKNVPIIFHCTAGVGRSGVAILTDIMLYSMDHSQDMNVPKVLTNLRHQRMLMVQTLAQYKFVYQVLIEYLKNNRLI